VLVSASCRNELYLVGLIGSASPVRTFPLIAVGTTLVVTLVSANEIREFDIKTIERLGYE
jgi:hypothetical protein